MKANTWTAWVIYAGTGNTAVLVNYDGYTQQIPVIMRIYYYA